MRGDHLPVAGLRHGEASGAQRRAASAMPAPAAPPRAARASCDMCHGMDAAPLHQAICQGTVQRDKSLGVAALATRPPACRLPAGRTQVALTPNFATEYISRHMKICDTWLNSGLI